MEKDMETISATHETELGVSKTGRIPHEQLHKKDYSILGPILWSP